MSFRVWRDGRFVEIDNPEDLANRVRTTLEYYRDEMTQAIGRSLKTREDVAADIVNEHDEENARLKEKLRFTIASVYSEKELEAYNAFVDAHLPCRMTKATGGSMPMIKQHSTGIGVTTKLTCPVCGCSAEITDTSCW